MVIEVGKLKTTKRDVERWIKELKSRNITEFMYKDLPKDLKKMGMIKKASAIDLIKRKAIIKSVTVWEIVLTTFPKKVKADGMNYGNSGNL